MATSRKKVLLRRFSGEVQAGHLPVHGFVPKESKPGQPSVDLLDLEGRVTAVPLAGLKWIAWVRDWNLNDRSDPERLNRKTFLARPRSEGLWVRVVLQDGDVLEGLAPIDLALLDGIEQDRGLFLMPPDIRSNTQRVFVPRLAIKALEVLAVVTTPSKKPAAPVKAKTGSGDLFPDA